MLTPLLTRPWLADVTCVLAGLILPLAFAPVNAGLSAILSLALLFSAWLNASPRRALWRGWLFGVAAFGAGVSWIFVSIYHYGGVPGVMAVGLTVLFVAFLALYPALVGYAVNRLDGGLSRPAVGRRLLLLMPAGWMLGEWLRGWMFTGFPWLNVGYSQIQNWLGGWAPVGGVYVVSLVAAEVAGCVAFFLVARRSSLRWRVSLGVLGLAAVSWGLTRVEWVRPVGDPLTVSLIQGNIPQDQKWLPALREPTIDLYEKLSRENLDSDLIIWPETAVPDFFHRAEDRLEALAALGRASQTDFLVGVLVLDRSSGAYFNSMVSLGTVRGFYHKRHLVPFTEYLPWKAVLGPVVSFMNVPMSDFSRGRMNQPPLLVAGQPVAVSICFEDAFGEELIARARQATLLVNVSNDAWFSGSLAPYQHLQIAQMRALETGRPMLRATNTGATAFVDHRGGLHRAPLYETTVLKRQVQPMRGLTPYTIVGNALALTAAVVLGGAAVLHRRRRLTTETMS